MGKPKLSIIDADGLIFKAAWEYRAAMNITSTFAIQREVDKQITALLNITHADYYIGFFGKEGKKNFRYDVGTVQPYKGKRKTEPHMTYFKPKIKKHLEDKWKFYSVGDIEGDDCLPITFHELKNDYDITLIYEDKDLKQIPNHKNYNFGKRQFNEYSEFQGHYNLWFQVIIGDSSDSVPGLFGKGAAYAAKVLDGCKTNEEMYEAVKLAYFEHYRTWEHAINMMIEQYMLVHMLEKRAFDYPENIELQPWKATTRLNKRNLLDI